MLLRIAPRFSGEVVVYESLIPGGTVSFMIDGEGRALNKSRSLRGARVVPVYSKWWDSPAHCLKATQAPISQPGQQVLFIESAPDLYRRHH